MSQTVIGIFDSSREAQDAVEQLVSNGFSRSNIDIAAQDATSTTSDRDNDNDGIGGFFRSLFGSDDDESRKYTNVARRGSVVTVHAQSAMEAERAADILDNYGAVDVNERYMQYNRDSNIGSASAATDTYATTNRADLDRDFDRTNVDSTNKINVVEENLQVGKREVTTGGVRLRSRIVERPVEESVRLRSEHVHVERNPVNRPATEADFANFQEGTIEVTEHAEVPVVNKEARVVEEINLNKDVEERVETIRDTVRSTDVDVENVAGEERRYDLDDDRTFGNDRRDRLDSDDDLSRPAGL